MAEKKETTKAAELQERLDEIRKEADAEGLAIVVAWTDEYAGVQSVTLVPTDKITIGVLQ